MSNALLTNPNVSMKSRRKVSHAQVVNLLGRRRRYDWVLGNR
jgi:hypothetical protein